MARNSDIEKLAELMKDIEFRMLTTQDQDGELRSRPMALQQTDFDGDLWFFTGKSTEKTTEIREERHVNVSFADPDDNKYVSISGTASIVDDRAKAKELWSPILKAWFPKGLEDPDLTLLKVTISKAEYWDAPHSTVAQAFAFVKSAVTGKPPAKLGDHEKVELSR